MKRLIAILALAALLAVTGYAQETPSGVSNERIDHIVSELSEITGLAKRREVRHSTISRDELKSFLEKRIREEVKPEEIRIEEQLLRKLGFVPPEFDLRQTTIDLYTEQAAAFYDFESKKLVLLEGNDAAMEEAALAHELAHALADQHFRLSRFLDRAGKNDDGALARMAVMEGQATWLMAELLVRQAGQSLFKAPEMAELMSRMVAASSGQFPVLDNAPLYIRESLLFPYTSGMKLQNAVVQKRGKAGFAEVFRNPPDTTRQVLHPETYLNPERVLPPTLPRLVRQGRYRTAAEGTIGEFDYAVLISQYVGEEAVRGVAPSWRAGLYRYLEHKREEGAVLLQATRWADAEKAGEFLRSYRSILEGKWETFEVDAETADRIAGRGDDGYFVVWRDGTQVLSAEGMSGPDELRAETTAR